MKSILEFTLPEEDFEFRQAIDGWKYQAVLQEFREELRSITKHEEHHEEVIAMVHRLREKLVELMTDRELQP